MLLSDSVMLNREVRYGTRMKDHTSYNSQPTAVGDHCREHGHAINKNNVEVLAREEGWFKRKVREAIEIKTIQPTINRDQGQIRPPRDLQ